MAEDSVQFLANATKPGAHVSDRHVKVMRTFTQ